jgi:hypothetical protein
MSCFVIVSRKQYVVSIGKQESGLCHIVQKEKRKCDITSLLGQMCPPAALSTLFGKLGPIVPSGVWRVISACGLPGTVVGRTGLVVVNCASSLYRGCGTALREGTRQRRWCGRPQGEGTFGSFSSLAGQSALTTAMVTIAIGHVGIINGAVVPIMGVPLRQDAVSVMAVDMWSRALTTPMTHTETVEAEPLRRCVRTHQVAWTTPSDDNCRQAVDGT